MCTIVSKVEQSENDSKDAKLLLKTTNLCDKYSKDLADLKLKIDELIKKFSVTPQGKLAQEIKKDSRWIKEEQGIQIYKLPLKLVNEVKPRFNFSVYIKCLDSNEF